MTAKLSLNSVKWIFAENVIVQVTGGWRKQNNDEFNDLYSSPNIVQVII